MSQYELREVEAVPAVYDIASCDHAEIPKTIGEVLPRVFSKAGSSMAGPPFVRYTEWTDSACTMEIGIPVNAAITGTDTLKSGELGGCLAVYTLHTGPYNTLTATHEATMDWIRKQGKEIDGAPWESYLTDPGKEPDNAKWQTGVYWPVKRN